MIDLIFFDGNIVTLDNKIPKAQAVAVKKGKILEIGTNEEILKLSTAHTKKVSIGGKLMLPGFIDSHLHLIEGGERLFHVNLRAAMSKAEFKAIFKQNLTNYQAGDWIIGGGWNNENWGGELPSKTWIDDLTPNNPVWVKRLDGHMALANSVALRIAGFSKGVYNIPGGEVLIENDELTGIFKDNAIVLIEKHIPQNDKSIKSAYLERAMDYLTARGVCSAHNFNLFDSIDYQLFEDFKLNKKLKIRLYLSFPLPLSDSDFRNILQRGKGDNWIKYGIYKGFIDGSLGSQTAAFFENYINSEKNGLYLSDIERLEQQIKLVDSKGFQVAMHAIGDRANHELLNIYQRVIIENGHRDRRFRIEHSQHLRADDIARFSELDVIPSMQPLHLVDDGCWAHKTISKHAINGSYSLNSLIKTGAKLAFGSDWFVAEPSPILGIHAAVNRQTSDNKNQEGWLPEQKIMVSDAVKAYTIGGAYASFDEGIKGSISSGKLADFVVLDKDIFKINPLEIAETKVILTVVDGRVVYQQG